MTHTMTHLRFAAGEAGSGDAPEWLSFIWACNRIAPGTFGTPIIDDHWSPDVKLAERYPGIDVLHRTDDSVSIVSNTPASSSLMRDVAKTLGINHD